MDPSHVDIEENEGADVLAKEACDLDQPLIASFEDQCSSQAKYL